MNINFLGDIAIFNTFQVLKIDPFAEIELPDSDFNIGNFESIVESGSESKFFDVRRNRSCTIEYLKSLNLKVFDAFGFANNHCLDYGIDGYLRCANVLEENGICTFGFSQSESYSLGVIKNKDIKIAIIGCVKSGRWNKSNFGYGPDEYEPNKIIDEITRVKNNYNHVVVYPHWGTEFIEVPNKEDIINASLFIDAGASAVIGHHPHISQGIEFYKNGIIAYSLGSFIYLPGEDIGYTMCAKNAKYSICLSVDFGEEKIQNVSSYLYSYDDQRKIPVRVHHDEANKYLLYLNTNIENSNVRKRQIVNVLFKREIKAFFKRVRMNPFRAFLHYVKYTYSFLIKRMTSTKNSNK